MASAPADLTKPQPRAHTADGGERLAARLVPLPSSYAGPTGHIRPAVPASAWGSALAASAGASAGAVPRFAGLFQLLRGGDPQLPSVLTWEFVQAFTGVEIKLKSSWVSIFPRGSGGAASKPEYQFMRGCGLLAPAASRCIISQAALLTQLCNHRRFRDIPAAQLLAAHLQALPPYTGIGSAAAAASVMAAAAEPAAAEQVAGGDAPGAAGGPPSAGKHLSHAARH